MPKAELATQVNDQISEIRKLVYNICEMDDSGNIKAKPGVTKEQLIFAIKSIKNVETIYNERIVDLNILNEELDEQEKNVSKTSKRISNLTKRFGSDVFPKWLLKAYSL